MRELTTPFLPGTEAQFGLERKSQRVLKAASVLAERTKWSRFRVGPSRGKLALSTNND